MPAPAPFLQCNRCGTILGAELVNQTQAKPCPHCRSRLLVWVFPAFFQPAPAGQVPEALGSGGELEAGSAESSCFFHPRFRAAEFCALCGRFLCALCDLPHAGNHLCPDCLTTQLRTNWQTESPSYDRMALLLAVVPLTIFPLTIFTAPAALLLVILSWNGAKNRPVKGTRSRLVVVALLALLEMAGWATFLAYALTNRHSQGV